MSGLLIVPILESLGLSSLISTGTEALGLTAAQSAFASTAATGIIAGEIAAPIDKKIYDSTENLRETGSDYLAMSSAAFNQDANYFLKREKKAQAQKEYISVNQKNILNTPLSGDTGLGQNPYSVSDSSTSNNMLNKGITQLDPTQSDPTQSDSTQPTKIVKIPKNPYNYTNDPQDLARLVIDVSKKLTETKDIKTATLDVLGLEPQAIPLAQRVHNYLANRSLPNTDEFKRISQVFNGKNLTSKNFSIARNPKTNLIEVSGINEIGQKFVLPQTTGFIIPSVYPYVFVGPNSANAKLPYDEITDFAAFFHDYSYRSGFFNKQGDLQFISRLSQNLDRVRPENRAFVRNTIIYFANVSVNLSMFVQQPNDDIFKEVGGVDPDDEDYEMKREEYYKSMDLELASYSKSNGFFVDSKAKRVKDILNSIEISIE